MTRGEAWVKRPTTTANPRQRKPVSGVSFAPSYRGPDHSSEPGAHALARRIERYWATNGYPGVVCTQPPMNGTGQPAEGSNRDNRGRSYFDVRSNIVSVMIPEGVK